MTAAGALAGFAELDRAGVSWCLWRGTTRLERAHAGQSDFDLLTATEDLEALRTALTGAGFKRARTADLRGAPELEDWLGLGGPTGPLHHVHVHGQMLVGEPRLYRFRLPWERDVLERRKRLPDDTAWAAAPTDEAALLLIRSALQVRLRDGIPGLQATGRIIEKIDHDLHHLLRNSSVAEVRARTREWIGAAAEPALVDLPSISPGQLSALRTAAKEALSTHTSQGAGAATVAGLYRQMEAGSRLLARRGRAPLLRATRTGSRGGRAIAVVASDVGRARLVATALCELFGTKLDILRVPDKGPADRRRARATAARDLGWLALYAGSADSEAAVTGSGGADAVVRLNETQGDEEQLAGAVAAVWDQV